MHPSGARKNKLAHAIFSNDGPYLNNPDVTSNPKVIPNKYSARSKKTRGNPSVRTDTPNRGIAIKTAGTNPINVLNIAVKVNAAIISLIFIGAINKLVKFLLHISSKNIMLKLILALNKKSYKIAAVRTTPNPIAVVF